MADIAARLEKPRRTHAEVNLGRIERYARKTRRSSSPARCWAAVCSKERHRRRRRLRHCPHEDLDQAGEAVSLEQFVEQNPEESNVRVIR